MNPDWFGPRLKELREAARLSQGELAERTAGAVSRATVANLEQSRCAPSWPAVIALCKALGVKCDAFLELPGTSETLGRGRPPKRKDGGERANLPRPSGEPKKR